MPTNNHNYSMPARGAEDWDQDWYDNFNALDAEVVLRGPAAERTTYTSYTDTLYVATDTEDVYRGLGDGVGWEQLESFGSDPTFGSVTAGSVTTDELNTVRYVDPGDGQANLQSVLDALETGGGGVCVLKPGTCIIDSPPLEVGSNVHLRGMGPGVSVIQLAGGLDGNALSVVGIKETAVNPSVQNLEIDGNEANNTYPAYPDSPGAQGLRVAGATTGPVDGYFANLYIHDTIRSCVTSRSTDCIFANLWLENASTDHWFYAAGSDSVTATNLYCSGFARSGIVVDNSPYTTINNLHIDNPQIPPDGNTTPSMIDIREGADQQHTTLDGVRMTNFSARTVGEISVYSPNTVIRSVYFDGTYTGPTFLAVREAAVGTTVENVRINIQNGRTTAISAVGLEAEDVSVEDVKISATGTNPVRGISVVARTNPLNNVTVSGAVIDVNNLALNLRDGGSGIERIEFDGLRIRNGTRLVDSTVYYTENGVGVESAAAETPTASIWERGDVVDFTDTTDGTGNGLYLLDRSDTWWPIATQPA